MSGPSESPRENGGPSSDLRDEPVKDDLDRKSVSRENSPVPGTSKSSGVRRRTSKEPKRSSPDPVEGHLMILRVVMT